VSTTKFNPDAYFSEVYGHPKIRYKQNGQSFSADGSPVEAETAAPTATASAPKTETTPVKKKTTRKKSARSGSNRDGLL